MADRFFTSNVQPQTKRLESLSTEEFLALLGQRIRFHRTEERMSRKRLAEVSGVSERYLAQLEAGQGNMSIALLRKVTTAIGLPLNVLLAEQEEVASSAEHGTLGGAAHAGTHVGTHVGTQAPTHSSAPQSHASSVSGEHASSLAEAQSTALESDQKSTEESVEKVAELS